jgi:hypothetical protein
VEGPVQYDIYCAEGVARACMRHIRSCRAPHTILRATVHPRTPGTRIKGARRVTWTLRSTAGSQTASSKCNAISRTAPSACAYRIPRPLYGAIVQRARLRTQWRRPSNAVRAVASRRTARLPVNSRTGRHTALPARRRRHQHRTR